MANHTKKQIEEIEQARSKLDKHATCVQYSCDHQRRPMVPALQRTTNNNKRDAQGNPTSCYKCEKCKALISATAPTNEEAEDAFLAIETMSNYMRLQIDSSTEKGKDKLKWHEDFMMHATEFFKSYKALRTEAVKKHNKQNSNDGKHGGAYYEG